MQGVFCVDESGGDEGLLSPAACHGDETTNSREYKGETDSLRYSIQCNWLGGEGRGNLYHTDNLVEIFVQDHFCLPLNLFSLPAAGVAAG